MSGIVALDVVIGLLFIFLLYSLLATVISEIIATVLGLRARNLKEAVDRMLNDDKEKGFFTRLWDSLRLMKNPKNRVIKAFYKQPEIKYQGSSGVYRSPSYISPKSFSKALLGMLFADGHNDKEEIENKLKSWLDQAKENAITGGDSGIPGPETVEYIYSLWLDAKQDIETFRKELEGWFDRTMRQATEWYRRKMQAVLLVLGFCLAWFFNADTFEIVKHLSVDKNAREQLVSMANAYLDKYPGFVGNGEQMPDPASYAILTARLDSLQTVRNMLLADIEKSGHLLGMGGWPSDEFTDDGKPLTFSQKLAYMLSLAYHHFFSYLIMALAVSLGAPFWFDLLNKLTRIRTPLKENTSSKNTEPKTS